MNVKYSDYMSKTCEQVSHGFLSRQFAPTSLEMAGTCIIDRRRNIVPNVQVVDLDNNLICRIKTKFD